LIKKFYDCNIRVIPDGTAQISEFVNIAKRLGFKGIAITNSSNIIDSDYFNNINSNQLKDFEIFKGIEIVTTNQTKLNELVKTYRKSVDILLVRGGDENINRKALENPIVDVLTHAPTLKHNGLNHILAKSAHDNDVAIEFNLDAIIQQRGGKRVHAISYFRKNLQLARKYGVKTILTSNASSIYDMRAPREMIALAKLFGMSKEEGIEALSATPLNIIEKNRKGSNIIQKGVEIVDLQYSF
jgi:ribonuclease P/MRP protein subunit RPP1